MHKMRRTTGVIFNSNKMIEHVINQLEKSGKLKTNNTNEFKRKVGAKVLIDSFMTNEMKYGKEDWNNVKVEEIHTGTKSDKKGNFNEVIYVRFEEIDEIKKFKNQLKHVSNDVNNRIIDFISSQTHERFQFFDNAAYQARQRGMRTKIIIGKYDFLLLTKHKSDPQSWQNIPPRIMTNLPHFKVGQISDKDIIKKK